MKKIVCILLAVCMVFALAACGAVKPTETEIKDWSRSGYFTDENENFLSVTWMEDMSHFVLKLVKTSVELSEADDTEAISKEVRLLLSDRSVFHRRFAEAYPEVIYRTERIAARMEEIRAETERLR